MKDKVIQLKLWHVILFSVAFSVLVYLALFNPRTVDSLRGTRTTYDLTYRVSEVPPNDAGNFTNRWTKSFEFGGYYKALLEADDIGELWIDDKKVLWTDRRKDKTYDEKFQILNKLSGPDRPFRLLAIEGKINWT